MDPAFFVGKVVLLKWLNDFFDAGYNKVEQTCTGAMHCQILDAIYPGKVPLGKVNFDAKTEYEYVANYKVLQTVFDSQQISKYVDVNRLTKGKFQDNLEMLQWMKHFFDTNYAGQPYDARARREEARAQYRKQHKHAGTGLRQPAGGRAAAAPAAEAAASSAARPAASKPAARVAASKAPASRPAARAGAGAKTSTGSSSGASAKETAELTAQLSKLSMTIEGLEVERNFYFGKLREIEILCQDADESNADAAAAQNPPEVLALKKQLLAILYATDENAQFQTPDDAGAAAAPGTDAAPADEAATASAPIDDIPDADALVQEGELEGAEGLLATDELQVE